MPQLCRGWVGDALLGSGAAGDLFAVKDEVTGFLLVEV